MKRDERFFQLAKKLSFKSPSQFKLGAVIVNSGHIISVGYNNMSKTHTRSKSFGQFLHAEIHALLGTSYEETKNGTIYVYRQDRNGIIADSRPCPICFKEISLAGIKRICYSTRAGFNSEKIL